MLSHLRYLVALNEHKHFRRAAEACNITQPALSNALRAIEAQFGVVIILRGRTFKGFTKEGEKVLAFALKTIREYKFLEQEISSVADNPSGRILFGAVPTMIPLATRFAIFIQAHYPLITPQIFSLSTFEIEKRLEDSSIDFGFSYFSRATELKNHLGYLKQLDEKYFFVRKSNQYSTGLVICEPMTWASAAQHPLCLFTPDMFNRSLIELAFRQAGVKASPILESNSINALTIAISYGQIASIMPGALVATLMNEPNVEAYPLIDPEQIVEQGLIYSIHETMPFLSSLILELAQKQEWKSELNLYAGNLSHLA